MGIPPRGPEVLLCEGAAPVTLATDSGWKTGKPEVTESNRITSCLPTTRKVARPVNARALSGAIRRCSRKLPEDNLRPPIDLDSPVALSPVLCCAASELLACRLALTSVCAELHLLSRALGYFGASATVRAKSLPTGGKPGRRNWRPRSLRDMPFRSTPETSGAGSDVPIHDGPLPASAEMICPALSVAAAMFECSCVALLRDRLCLDAAPQVAASECLLLVH